MFRAPGLRPDWYRLDLPGRFSSLRGEGAAGGCVWAGALLLELGWVSGSPC